MAITVQSIVTNLNTYTGDASEDRISNAERFQFITEAVSWLQESLGNEHMNFTYDINYISENNYYKLTSVLPDVLVGADLRRQGKLQTQSFTRKSPRELAEEIGQNANESAWAIERKDGDSYLVINHRNINPKTVLANFDSATSDNGTWTVDSTGSDALNLTYDINEYTVGGASLNFDADVSQSANDLATVYINRDASVDLSSLEDLGFFTLDVYLPDVTEISSVTIRVGSEEGVTPATIADYWTSTSTTDINGNALAVGWNKVKFEWASSSVVGTPDSSTIFYYEISINYTASQTDDTDFRLDNFAVEKPEKLTFHYISFYVGTNSSGTNLLAFTALTDIPFFSGEYDQYKYAVARQASAYLYYSLRLKDEAAKEEEKAYQSLQRYRLNFESSKTREEKSFKVKGLNMRRRAFKRRIR